MLNIIDKTSKPKKVKNIKIDKMTKTQFNKEFKPIFQNPFLKITLNDNGKRYLRNFDNDYSYVFSISIKLGRYNIKTYFFSPDYQYICANYTTKSTLIEYYCSEVHQCSTYDFIQLFKAYAVLYLKSYDIRRGKIIW